MLDAWKDGLRSVCQQVSVPPPINGCWERVYLTLQEGQLCDQVGMAAKQILAKPYSTINIVPHSGTVDTEHAMIPQHILPESFLDVRLRGNALVSSAHDAGETKTLSGVYTDRILAAEMEDGSFIQVMGPFRSGENWGIKGARIPRQILSSETLQERRLSRS